MAHKCISLGELQVSQELSGLQPLPDRRGYRRECKECQVPTEERDGRREGKTSRRIWRARGRRKVPGVGQTDGAWQGAIENE